MTGGSCLCISYRVWAWSAAILQLPLLAGLYLLLCVFALAAFHNASVLIQALDMCENTFCFAFYHTDSCFEKVKTSMARGVWLYFAAFAVAFIVQFQATKKLFDATMLEMDSAKGLKAIQYWWIVNRVFLAIEFLYLVAIYIVYKFEVILVTPSILRVVSLCLVYGYKSKLTKET